MSCRESAHEDLPCSLQLSHGQRSLWFLHHLAPAAGAYNIAAASRLRSPLDPERLERAFQALVDRHGALRTTFPALAGEPCRRVAEHQRLILAREDATGWSAEELRERLATESWRPFDLESGPLLRVTLFTGAPDGPVLLLVIHHIVADFGSLAVVMRELPALYRGAEPGPPGLPYDEHVRREGEAASGELLDWWREQLAGLPNLELPTDRPRPAVQTYRGDTHRARLAGDLAAALRALSRARHGTLFMTLTAAFQALLGRYSGQDDVAVGTARSGRSQAQLAGTVGYLVNQVVLRGDLAGDPAFVELLERTQRRVREAFAHGDYPFPLLAEHLQPERDASRTPLFQVSFVLQKETRGAEGLTAYALGEEGVEVGPADFRLETLAVPRQPAPFDLVLHAVERQGGLSLALQYNADLFDATTTARLLEHFERLLAGVAADPARRLSELPLLSAAERAQLLVEWNDTEGPHPRPLSRERERGVGKPVHGIPTSHELTLSPLPLAGEGPGVRALTLSAAVRHQAALHPDLPAVVSAEASLTYRDLAQRAGRLAARLRARGVGPEVPVALCVERSAAVIVAILGILEAGGAYMPLDPNHPPERLATMLADAGRPLLITERRRAGALTEAAREVLWLEDEEELRGELPVVAAGPENLAYVLHTSGSTGKPKGVCCHHAGVLSLLADFARRQPLAPGSRGSLWTSLGFDVSVYEIFVPLLAGGAVHIAQEEIRQDAERFLDWLAAERIESAYVPPFMVAALRDRLERTGEPAALRRLLVGVEPIPEPVLTRIAQLVPGLAVINGYGPTEATICCTLYDVDPRRDAFGQPPLPPLPPLTPIGRPAAGTGIFLLGRHGEPVPLGVPGEVCIAGVGLARGYWRRPEATAERFVPHLWGAGERLYRTGDLARHRADGNLEFIGRVDHQIKLRGFRIEPGEIEAVLLAHPEVREAVVLVWPPGGRELEGREHRRLVAYVVLRQPAARPELAAWLRERLPAYMVPAAVIALDAFPLTPSGKLDRKALPAPGDEGAAGFVAPRTPTEELVAGMFAEVLGVERIGAEDSFFERGGHSLAALKVLARVRAAFGVELPAHRVFETPTVAGLAAAIEAAARSGAPAVPPLVPVPRQTGEPLPLSFPQQRLWFLHQLEPESPAYNVPAAVHLRGRLDPAALAAALDALAQRHETLRTRFGAEEGRPVQIVDPPASVPLPQIDLERLPAGRVEPEARRLAHAEASRPFDLETGPLLRAALVRWGAEEHLLLLTLHHIVSDGWSLRVLARELGEIYGALAEGRPAVLPPLDVQYGDYAVWQRSWLRGAVLEAELAYWRDRLAGAPPVLDLPLDRPRTPGAGDRGASRAVALPPWLLPDLHELARQHGVTLFMAVLAAWQALLARVSGSADVSVGTPVAGRGQMRTEGLIGFFVNTLVLRTDLSGAPPFAGLLARVRETALAAYAHQDLPFEKLVEELAPLRDLGDAPLVQAAFALDEEPPPRLRLGAVEASLWPLEAGAEKFDLTLILGVDEAGLHGALGFRTALFDGTTIERLGGHFARLLAAAVAAPETRLPELPLLSDGERQQLVAEWNDTRAPFPEAILLHQFFEASVERTPEAVAAVCAGHSLTYAELDARSNRLAHLLREAGVRRGTPVGVWIERSLDLPAAVLGVLKAGGHYVALDETWPADRVETILAATGAPAIVAGAGLLGAVEEMRWRLPALAAAICPGIAEPEPPAEAVDPTGVRELWDLVAEQAVDRVTAGGFVSAFTGAPMSAAEVDEYRDRVLTLASPWLRPEARVLEIGNGSGLLLWEIAARGAHATGIDPSPRTQERNREHAELEGIGNVELRTGFAHEVDGLLAPEERFDLILLASTVQFFPGPRYLEQVVRQARARLAPGGALLIADVLDARRREELRQVTDEHRRARGLEPAAPRRELFLDEGLFRDLGGTVHHRSEGFPNELRYRYDVLLPAEAPAPRRWVWTGWHVERSPADRMPAVATPDDVAYVIHTSGSTGEPKGIVVQHRPAANLIHWVNRTFAIGPADRGLFVTSLAFDLSVWDVFGMLAAGGTVHVATRGELGDPDHLVGLLRTGGITVWDSAPAALVQLAPLFPAEPDPASRLRRVLLSGDWIPVTLPDRVRSSFPGAAVMALGGATEATVWSNWFPVGTVDPSWPSIPYGRPIANARYHVLDEGLAPCPIGVAGDLYIGGGCLCTGYARRPELTAAAFLPDPFAGEPGARIYRTGDRARAFADGNLEFLGRLDQQVKIRGYRIELGEIEVALARHPAVREAVVLARADEPGDPRLVAYVVPAGEPSAAELRDALRRSLPESMIPSAFVFLPALPVTPNGKLDRQALPAPVWNVSSGEGEEPRTPTEARLAAIWSEVLGVPHVGRDDGFFDLGGHSLLATQMLARVRAACGVELSLRTLFEHPKLADLAAWIDAAAPSVDVEERIVRAPREGALPLSFAQQRLWFLDLMEPGSPLYHITAAVEMVGRLDVAVLAAALGEVVRRHEALRVTFRDVGGVPAMDLTSSAVALPVIDLQIGGEAEANRLSLAEARRPFDLRTGPLLRVTLLLTAPEHHRLILVLHHIVSDGWSMGVLVRELGALYAAFAQGRPSPLPELAVQVPDFAAWQRRHLAGAFLEAETAWWRERLAEMPAVLELPVDHPRPAARSVRGAVHAFAVGRDDCAAVADLARRSEATLFMTLLAAFAALLGKLTGQDDLAVGTPVAGRTRIETEPLIGLFVNTLVLRMDLAGDPQAAALLARVRETALAAFGHQELPFERLVEELAPERDLRRPPLVQVLFAVQNAPAGPLELPGLELSVHPLDTGTAKFELTFVLTESAEGLRGEIEYSADLFDAASIERLAGRYVRLLTAMADDPRRHLSELPVLTAAEEAEIRAWNDTARPYPRDASLAELFAAVAAAQPEAPAVLDGAEVWSYRRLDEASSRLAGHLQGLGVRPGEPVALSLERSAELVVGMLAILKAGGFYVPLDASYPEERRRWMLEDAGARVVVDGREIKDGKDFKDNKSEEDFPLRSLKSLQSWVGGGLPLAYLIYTSGSTGRPKGVAVPQSAVVRLVRNTDYARLGPGSRVGMLANISFDAATWEIWGPLLNGGAAVVVPRDVVLSPQALAATLREQRVTSLFLTTTLFIRMAREVPDAFAGLDEVLFGGEAADPDAARAVLAAGPPRRLLNVYGPTESTTYASWYQVRAVAGGAASLPIGGPLANTTLWVLDRRLAPVPPGSPGELCIGGDGLAWGYWNRPELTAERFVPHPGEDGGRLYRTGDLVRRVSGGPLDFLGRIDQQVKIRGFRVEPGEIEAALLEHPAVREAAVAVVPGAGGLDDRRLAAWVAGDAEAAVLRQLLRDKLPAHMVPSFLTVLPALPLTPSGKLDRRALLALPLESGADAPAAPRTPVEELVAGVFAEVLGRERVGVAESFFELGGHSLLAAQVVARVRAVLGVELPVRTLFEAPTVESLAAALTALRAESAPPPEPPARVERPGPLPLTFAQERLWFLQQLEPGSDTYNMPVAVELAGALDLPAFAAALAGIVRRQESLRTTFPLVDGAPRQWIAPEAGLALPLVDLSGVPDGAAEAERLEHAHAALGFDLERGPLARWLLVRLGAERHRFLLSLHHTIADGWSLGVLVRELGALYGAFREGKPSPLPELPVQVADFAVWQRTWLAERQEAQLAYWESRLGGESTAAELPADRPRPAVQSFRGGRRSLVLSPELTTRLHGFGRGAGATLFMTLLAATQALLARHSGEPEVTVGAPIAGRPWKETEGVIGCFLNTLALRTDTSGAPSFRELVARVRTVTLEAYAHQDVPFEAVLARLRLDRDLSRSPLFQVLFNLLSLPPSDLSLPGLDLRVLTPAEVPSKLDVTFYVSEAEGLVWIHLVYNAGLFDAARMADLLAQLELLLAQGVERPDEPVDRLSLVTAAARAVLPDPAAPLPVPAFPSVARLFLDQAEALPGQKALDWSRGSWTYAELSARALEVAEALRGAGAGVGAVVAVSGPRGPELIAGLLGVFLAGGVLLILDPGLPEARRRVMLDEAAPVCLLEESADGWQIQGLRDQPAASSAPGPDDPAYVFFTSGTTGRPKAVLGRQKGLSHFLTWQRATFGIGPGDRAAQLTGLSFDVVLRDIFLPLTGGATLVLPGEDDFSPERLLSWLREREISVVHTVPSLASAWLGAAPAGFRSEALRWTFFAGEPLLAQVVARWRAAFPRTGVINLYGPTETTLAKCFYRVPDPPVQDVQPVGTPLPQTQALVLYGEKLCGLGEVGEIVIRTPFRSLGYLNNPEENRRFRPNPFRDDPGDLVYVSGDRGRYRLDGTVEILGRLDEQVKIRGVRVEPAEIRAALGRHPAVWESAVLIREQRPGDQRLVAYLVLRPGAALDPEDLRRHLRQELPEAMVPSTLVTVEALPLTPNGKLDRRALAQMGTEIELKAGGDARRALLTPVEEIVAGVVGEVLGVAQLGPDAHFFQLGGHSLSGAQVVSRLRQAFQVDLPLRVLFEAPTVAGLAAEVERLRLGDAPERPAISSFRQDRSAPAPLSFAQERFWAGRELEARTVASTIPTLVLLRGALDLGCLRAALQEIIDRHEVLRTTFQEGPDGPVQIIHPVIEFELPVIDLEPLGRPEQTAEVQRWSTLDGRTPFDYEHGPLFRMKLFRCAEREHVILFTIHHVAFDGWSRSILINELALLYNAFREGRPSPLRPLATQYQDFARWQRRLLRGEALEQETGFWREYLRGAVPVRLGERPARPTWDAGVEPVTIPAALERKLDAFAAEHSVTLFMTLLAVFKALVHGESGQDDVVVTCLFANRNQLETEDLIGNFFAGLPVRTRLAGVRTFRGLLERVRDETLRVHEHPDILYEQAMAGLSFLAPGERGGLATFRLLFQLAKLPPARQGLAGLDAIPLPFDSGKIRQDLSLFLAQGERLGGRFKYNRDVLDAETVVRLRDRFLQILAVIVEQPDTPLEELRHLPSHVLALESTRRPDERA